MTIKALIWDFEGVLLQTGEVDVAMAAAKRLNVPDADVREIFKGEFNDRMDLGEFSQDEYWDHVLHALDLPESRKENLNDFFYKDLYVDQDVLEDVRQYHQSYKTGLLTNFSRILPSMLENHWKIDGAFDEIVISSEIGMIKPDPGIYRYMLNKLGCSASEAVFVDDRIINVRAAQEIGLEAVLFTNLQEVNQKLQAILA